LRVAIGSSGDMTALNIITVATVGMPTAVLMGTPIEHR